MQLLLYPATDVVGEQASRETFAEGFLLTRNDMRWFEDHYLPDGCETDDPRASMMRANDVSGLPPAYVATAGFDPLRDEGEIYAARMRDAGVTVALQRHPGLIHGFANLTAICPNARAAMLEVAGALRMGLGLVPQGGGTWAEQAGRGLTRNGGFRARPSERRGEPVAPRPKSRSTDGDDRAGHQRADRKREPDPLVREHRGKGRGEEDSKRPAPGRPRSGR